MWLYVPPQIHSRSSISVPEQECSQSASNSPSKQSGSTVQLWVTLSGKAVRRPLSWHAWKARQYAKLLSGATLNQSTQTSGVAAWTSSWRDIRANRSRHPGNDVAKAIRDTFGQTCVERLRASSPASCSSKTYRGMSAREAGKSSAICKRWATGLRADCLARRKRARTIAESGCLSWGTPKTTPGAWMNQRDGTQRATLAGEAETWPTPQAHDAQKGKTACQVAAMKARTQAGVANLNEASEQWPTPNVVPNRGPETRASKKKRGSGGVDLQTVVTTFPDTPQRETTTELGLLLQNWTPPECPRLNPRFAEWLMGWCPGLTACGSLGTVWTLWWQRTRSSLCRLVSMGDAEKKKTS